MSDQLVSLRKGGPHERARYHQSPVAYKQNSHKQAVVNRNAKQIHSWRDDEAPQLELVKSESDF